MHDLTAFFPWLGVRVTSQPYSREKQGPQEGAGSPQSQEPECRPGERGCTPPPADTPGHERPGLVALNHLIIHLANVSPQAESGSIHSEFQIIIVFQIACMGPLQSQRVTTIGQQGPAMEISYLFWTAPGAFRRESVVSFQLKSTRYGRRVSLGHCNMLAFFLAEMSLQLIPHLLDQGERAPCDQAVPGGPCCDKPSGQSGR